MRRSMRHRQVPSTLMGDVCVDIRIFKSDRKLLSTTALAVAVIVGLSACQTSEVFHNGYVVDQAALDLVPVGSSREQVLLSLGTPSTTATLRPGQARPQEPGRTSNQSGEFSSIRFISVWP